MIDGFHGTTRPMREYELIRALVILLSSCFVLSHCAEAQYYVAKTGSDSNSGSASAPWLATVVTSSAMAAAANAASSVRGAMRLRSAAPAKRPSMAPPQ